MAKELCLVTGGAGFIGSHICEGLLQRGYRVRTIDDFSTGNQAHIKDFASDMQVIRASILDDMALAEAMAGVSWVFHEAAIRSVSKSVDDPEASNNANVTGTLKVLMAAKKAGVKRVMYASSSSLYGDGKEYPQKETMLPRPISPYAVSKLAGELYCRVYTKSFGLPTVSYRYFNAYGPRQDPESIYSAVIPRFMELAMEDKPLEVHWDGKQSRDFSYVTDIVEANIIGMTAPEAALGETFNIAGGKTYALLDLIGFIEKTLGRKLKITFHPKRTGDVRKTNADISKARRLLKFRPKTTFEQGLRNTWDYFMRERAPQAIA